MATKHVLLADRWNQQIRDKDGKVLRLVTHRKGDVIEGIDESDTERLLAVGAIKAEGADDPKPEKTPPGAEAVAGPEDRDATLDTGFTGGGPTSG